MESKSGETNEGETTTTVEGQVRTSQGPKPATSLTSHGPMTKHAALTASASNTNFPRATVSVSNLSSEEVTRQRSTSSLRRKKIASATAIKITEKTGERFGESREEIYEDFQHQLNALTVAPKAKVAHGKAKSRVMMVFMPTYRLEPIRPFATDHAKMLMERVLEIIKPMKYDEATVPLLVQALSKCIINVIKLPSCHADRYKLACQVRILEKKFQGYTEKLTVLWAHELDRIIMATVENHWMIATAVLSACYFD